MILDIKKIDNPHFEGVESNDYPDFSNAFIAYCDYDGREATEEEIEYINEHFLGDFWDEMYQTLID